jgi:hypothetical protein
MIVIIVFDVNQFEADFKFESERFAAFRLKLPLKKKPAKSGFVVPVDAERMT